MTGDSDREPDWEDETPSEWLARLARQLRRSRRGRTDAEVPSTAPAEPTAEQLDAIDDFSREHPEFATIAMLRYAHGRSVGETALVLGVTEEPVVKACRFARAWIARRLAQKDA